MAKTVAIIQARMSSSRLPGKIMVDIAGKPMLQHVINRTRKAQPLDMVGIATSVHQQDDVVAAFCRRENVPCFRGSLDDVLDRYYQAARHFDACTIVRITADCPLLDPHIAGMVIEKYMSGNYDYVNNVSPPTYPDGLDTEVFSFSALEKSWKEARQRSEREHVTPYIYNHQEHFRIGSVTHHEDLSVFRWTVDTPQDLEFVRAVYHYFKTELFGMEEILNLLQKHPEFRTINKGIQRNEGYQKSLLEDDLYRGKI